MHSFLLRIDDQNSSSIVSIAAISITSRQLYYKADECPSSEDTIEMEQHLLDLALGDVSPPEQFPSMLSGTTYG
jgi:hypothetical protein